MVLYLSGDFGTPTWDEEHRWLQEVGSSYRCFSYYYIWDNSPGYSKRYAARFYGAMEAGYHILLDSGGHTLHQLLKGKGKVTHEEFDRIRETMFQAYIVFCQKYQSKLDSYVTFDYQPDAKITLEMTQRMWDAGLEPLPVYHGDTEVEWLEQTYLKHGCEYVGLSGVVTGGKNRRTRDYQKLDYLDACFRKLCFADGRPKVRVHGFAVTAFGLMDKFPFWSVDSATWMKVAMYGKIIMPGKRTRMLKVSKRSVGEGESYWSLSNQEKERLEDQFQALGFGISKLSDPGAEGTLARKTFNAKVFIRYIDARPEVRLKSRFVPMW